MVDYEINEDTLAILPEENRARVYEGNSIYIIEKPVYEILEQSCEYFGSTLEGRQRGTFNLIGITHKAPIIVEETKELIFFPTNSPRVNKCGWISLNNLQKYYSENGDIYVEFKNRRKIKINVSYGIIDNQILRATRLESVLRQRKNKK